MENCRVMVVGMGVSGMACADLLLEEGAHVILSDRASLETFPDLKEYYREALESGRIHFALGEDPEPYLEKLDMLVVSPGVPMTLSFIQKAKQNGIEVIGEIELGYRYAQAPIVAITGTNGKTTTTALTGELFRSAGKNTYVLGNIGIPIACEAKQTTPDDVIVAEVAGFQLESTIRFHAPCCAVLNIREDHLDRFGTMETYIASKEKIFENQTENDFAVLNADDPVVRAMEKKTKARVLFFSCRHVVEQGAFVEDGSIVFRFDEKTTRICDRHDLRIPGLHNLENALAAVCLGMASGLAASDIARALRSFEGVEHRIEFVSEIQGVRYINDSKGTNPDSTIKAIEAMGQPTVLLLGGSNKNSDYVPVFESFGDRIKAVVALGETAPQILRDAKKTGFQAITVCEGSFEEAVHVAAKMAEAGDNVLLSPACASYDMFRNFEERGAEFKRIVAQMAGRV